MWCSLPMVGLARAQPTADLHGDLLPVQRGLEGDPSLVWAPPVGSAGRLALGLGIEALEKPALLTVLAGGQEEHLPLLDLGVGLHPQLRWSLSKRVDLALSGLVFPALSGTGDPLGPAQQRFSGPALGDATLAVPLGLGRVGGTALGLVPLVTVPLGAEARWAGERWPTAGALATVARGGEDLVLGAHAGLVLRPQATVLGQVRGPVAVPLAAGLGARVQGPIWLRGQLRATPALGSRLPTLGTDVAAGIPWLPVEAMVGLGGSFGPVWSGLDGGLGLTDGIGSPRWRGIGVATWVQDPNVVPTEGPRAPPFRFEIVDPRGWPVADAEVRAGGQWLGVTDADGVLVLEDPPKWTKGVEVVADRFERVPVAPPVEGTTALKVDLEWAPSSLAATVRDASGGEVEARLVAESVESPGVVVEGAPGEIELPAGTWRVRTEAAGLAPQTRVVTVDPAVGDPEPLEVVLSPSAGAAALAVTVTDPEGQPVEHARVLVDGVPVGATASGGVVELAGLAAGPHEVEVLHPAFTGASLADLEATDGAVLQVPVPLQRVPGSVKVVVRDALGRPVTDAVARFVGPSRLPPMALGERGERISVLGPGEWQLVVTSEEHGVQERAVEVPPDRYELITVEVVLQPDEAGTAELVVRLVDPAGLPVEGAAVSLDGKALGTTSTGGTLELSALQPGVRSLGVALDGLRPVPDTELVLSAGVQERVLKVEWLPGVVDVVVRGPEGPVPDARVRLLGDDTLGPDDVGPTGRHRMVVAPGAWTAVVTSADYGVQERDLAVAPDSTVRHVADFVLAPVEGGLASLAVRVLGPDDRPVDGAVVLLDGEERGRTANTGTIRLDALQVGVRELEVRADPYLPETRTVKLLEGERELEVPLDWAPGAVKVHVHAGREPVTDAFVRFLGDVVGSPSPVDARGDRLARLDPGSWLVVATSPTAGVAEWELDVKPRGGLQVVDLDLSATPPDRADLLVQVVDPDGRPVEGAEVWIDGQARAGETAEGGATLARGLPLGPVTLTVKAPDHLPSAPLPVELVPGTVERIVVLQWEAVPVTVRTFREDGSPLDATVQWVGPGDVSALRSGTDGEVQARLPPGTWRVIARSGDLSGEAKAVLDLGAEPRPIELALLPTAAVMAGETVLIREQVHFDFGQATLRPDSGPVLDQVARVLSAETDLVRVEVQGHTDDVGGVAVNQALSQARAEAVVAALVARGVPRETLIAVGYGPTRPVAPNDGDEGRAANRRVQFEVLERAAPTVVPGSLPGKGP